jgi:hypothetical protein
MSRSARSWTSILAFLLLVATTSQAAVTDDYLRDITADYNRISDSLNSQLARSFGFYASLGWMDGPGGLDLLKGPRVEFGGGVGVDLAKVDSTSIPLGVLSPDSNVDIPSTLPLPYPVWHARVGVLKGLDIGFRGTGLPRIQKEQISVANRGFGFALRYLAIHGLKYPDVSVQATWDFMKGDVSFATDVDQATPYTSGGTTYNGTIQGTTLYQEIWNVRSFGLKVMVGKSVGIFHPYAALGFQRHAGEVTSKLWLDLTGTIEGVGGSAERLSAVLTRSAEPPITQPKYMVGFELGSGFYWSNLFETNGHDYAVATGFRAKI